VLVGRLRALGTLTPLAEATMILRCSSGHHEETAAISSAGHAISQPLTMAAAAHDGLPQQ